ncbi:hypothetical protein MASR2M15_23350 [Anaerolineales bacterium]
MALFNQLLEAQKRLQNELLKKNNVVGVGVGYRNFKGEPTDDLALIAMVERKVPVEGLHPSDLIPREINGIKTDVFEVGRIEALQAQGPRDRYRPQIPAGVSIGHYKVTAGTFGAVVYDQTTGEPLILSNNHVLAASNDGMKGDAILQPAPTDHGMNPADVVAYLERYIKLYFIGDPPPTSPPPVQPPPVQPPPGGGYQPPPTNPSGCDVVDVIANLANWLAKVNGSDKRMQAVSVHEQLAEDPATAQTVSIDNMVDAALAKPINPAMLSGMIRHIGTITGTKAPTLGMSIRKSGRTTDYTEGMITLVNATVNVAYHTVNGPKTARFTGQILASPMSQGGDSGALMVEQGSTHAVGLLFAGSGAATIFTPIDKVLSALNIRF